MDGLDYDSSVDDVEHYDEYIEYLEWKEYVDRKIDMQGYIGGRKTDDVARDYANS